MSSTDILDEIIVICSEQSNFPATADSNLITDLALDSLDTTSLCLTIESHFPGIGEIDYIPESMTTVRDLASYVAERMRISAESVQ